ncbi:DNA topoisomerase IV subunit A [Fructilactobacillus florum]|nr:DNA topoisomerase IV subunit A [Fructilactobacillus florum]
MPKKATIKELALATVMDERFSRYSKSIIQERALPDIRDGLKPVQRRILYSMNKDGNTYEKGFRKAAKSVGNVMGNFHPHGDSSIYEAMVRMSQAWKLRAPLIDMHGNNGSMDGDPPAAMRYTEARLSKISNEILRDIDKETVDWVLNFDDTEKEPTVLPARIPNLLINGATGISAGYATEIPPHNLAEVVGALIHLQEHPDASLEELMNFIKGPDFPTGGIIQGLDGIKQAYQTGRGRIMIRSRSTIKKLRSSKEEIRITEIPYEVNKSQLVKQIDEIRLNKEIDGIAEVRDDSDRSGLLISIEIKRNADTHGILNYLYKNTDLQVSYNFNVVAIKERRPQRLSLKSILTAYLDYQRTIITNRTNFDLRQAQARQHIVTGLIKALSILDQVIATIRASANRTNARDNLVKEYQFTEQQADAIVALQLYRLTNTDVTKLQAEHEQLTSKITEYNSILADSAKLDQVLRQELTAIAAEFKSPRRSTIEAEIEDLQISKHVTIPAENVMVLLSHDGYFKRSSLRSFKASDVADNGLKQDDYPVFIGQLNTQDIVYLFTDRGNLIYRPVNEIDDLKWKDTGSHISQLTGIDSQEKVIAVHTFQSLKQSGKFLIASRAGHIKQVQFDKLLPTRTYKTRATSYLKLSSPTDAVVSVAYVSSTQAELQVLLVSQKGLALRYPLSLVSTTGAKAGGVQSMKLAADDRVVNCQLVEPNNSEVAVIFQDGSFKKLAISDIPVTTRGRKGIKILHELKSRRILVADFLMIQEAEQLIQVRTDHDQQLDLVLNKYHVGTRTSNGTKVLDPKTVGVPVRLTHLLGTGPTIAEKS